VAVRQPKGWRCLGGPRPFFSKDPGRFANVPRQHTPEPPKDLGAAGRDAWNYVWRHHWIVPERRMILAERYCWTRDLLQQAFATVAAEGLMSVGSHGQQRAHPCMAAIRLMSTESRLMEIELGLTPVAESRAGIPKRAADAIDRRADPAPPRLLQPVDDDDDGDPRSQLKPIAPA